MSLQHYSTSLFRCFVTYFTFLEYLKFYNLDIAFSHTAILIILQQIVQPYLKQLMLDF